MLQRILPDPVVSPETEAFWSAASEGRFLVRHCTACARSHWYPRTMCPFCASIATEWRDGSGTATVYSYSVMRRASEPFVMAYVTLSEGPTMMTNIVDCDADAIRIGDALELVFCKSESGFSVPCFRPAPPSMKAAS